MHVVLRLHNAIPIPDGKRLACVYCVPQHCTGEPDRLHEHRRECEGIPLLQLLQHCIAQRQGLSHAAHQDGARASPRAGDLQQV